MWMLHAQGVFSAIDGVIMRRRPETVTRLGEPQVTQALHTGAGPDWRLVQLVRVLARRAARQWYAEQVEAQRQKKETGLPPI